MISWLHYSQYECDKRKKRYVSMKKFWAISLASVLLLAALASCARSNEADNKKDSGSNFDVQGNEKDDNSDYASDETDTSADKSTSVNILTAGVKTDYVITYSVNLSDECKDLIRQLAEKLNVAYPGIEITTKEVLPNFQTDVHKHEILIGDTGREESLDAASRIADYKYIIKLYDNNKLVIYGANDTTIKSALEYFTDTYATSSADALVLESGFRKTDTVAEAKRKGWVLTSIPTYRGGTSLSLGYDTGYGFNITSSGNGGKMQVISNTTAEEYDTYIQQLKASGYVETASHTIGANKYAQYKGRKNLVYVYYTDSQKEVRVIHDTASTPEDEFEYSYVPKKDDTSTFYQYALTYHPRGIGGAFASTGYDNAGLCNVIKLADNSVILIDGGEEYQATDAAVDGYMSFLRTITGQTSGKIRVAAIFLTHGHADHIALTNALLKKYANELDIERIMFNFKTQGVEEHKDLVALLERKYPEIKFAKLHTGQCIQLANAKFEVLYTHEDLVSSLGISEAGEVNNHSTVLKMTMNEKTMMILGDIGGSHNMFATTDGINEYRTWEKHFLNAFAPNNDVNYLKCDAVQISHHGLNDYLDNVYKKIDPDMAFLPTADIAYSSYYSAVHRRIIDDLLPYVGSTDNIHAAGRYTYGWNVSSDGAISMSYTDIAGASSNYHEQLNKYEPLHAPSGTKF